MTMKLHGPKGPGKEQGPQQQIAVEDTTIRKCECGSECFVPASKFGEVSSLHPSEHAGQLVQFPTWVCAKCGEEPKPQKEAAGDGNG